MAIDASFFYSRPVEMLCSMFGGEYLGTANGRRENLPPLLNALGACAGFAAQHAVWQSMILPKQRDPGEFLTYAATKSHGTFFFGEAINIFLIHKLPNRVGFWGAASAMLPNDLVNINEILSHVASSVGTAKFGHPRLPQTVRLAEVPQEALTRTWAKVKTILQDYPSADWPAFLGAAAHSFLFSHFKYMDVRIGLKILLEAAIPMSKLNPQSVPCSGIPAPSFGGWSNRAITPDRNQEIVGEVLEAMSPAPSDLRAGLAIPTPIIAFANVAGKSCETILSQDFDEIGGMFSKSAIVANGSVPVCHVLFLYCNIERDGKVAGLKLSVRDIIDQSGASVVVLASQIDFDPKSQFANSLAEIELPCNLVITNNRNGSAFGQFYKCLFEHMQKGTTMPMAWVLLAPQGPSQQSDKLPGSICLMGAGQVLFAR